MHEIKANEIGALLRGRMGLIIGPSITKYPGCLDEVSQKIADRGGVKPGDTYLTTGDALSEKGVADADVRTWVREVVGAQKKSSFMGHITKNRWCAVLSAALDAHFEDGFQQEADRHATWQPVTVLADFMMPPPPRTVPVFKLLGVAARDNFARSTVSYLDRRATWRHAVKGLDFRRTLGGEMLALLTATLANPTAGSEACVISGGAVTGKTVLLKRLAWELAKAGAVVLWLKPWSYQDGPRFLRELFKEASDPAVCGGKRIAVVMDDPVGFGSLSPKDVVLAANGADLKILLVAGVRASEWGVWEQEDLVGGLPIVAQEELPDELDEAEWAALPDYLVALGVAPDRTAALAATAGVRSHSARDTLSMLYWLLPEPRAGIGSSIRDEYHRLGDVAGLAKVILGTVNQGTAVLKSAYEMVAVSDHYRASIPMEVLVSALGVSYPEWVDATRPDSAAWGLFYAEESDDHQVCYRTRNSIVTRMIVEAINGGTLGRTGELRVMNQLLRACTGNSLPVYREFCVRVLVPLDKLDRLEYDEGLQLYDEAIQALPRPDKTLVHHKGLWVKNKGRDATLATIILEQALNTPVFPYAQRSEADGHIHTSIAAAVLDGVNQGKEKVEEGKVKILDHLSKARSKDFFNPRAVHVQANLISHLAEKVDDSGSPDYFAMINQSVADVDHTLILLRSHATQSTHPVSDIKMLEQIRDDVLVKTNTLEDLKNEADRVWNDFGSQEGFVLVARKLYASAQLKNKKFNAAYFYCHEVMERIVAVGETPSASFFAVAAQIFYHWRVRRQTVSGTGAIDWQVLRDLCHPVVSSQRHKQDPLYKHMYALSLAHLGNWAEANALYGQIRLAGIPPHVLWIPRDFLLNETGGVRTVQGVMRSGANREFFFAEDLGTDFHVDRKGRWPRTGEIAHGAIQFSFGGPTVVEWG
jgi:hypothetical protein